MIEFIKPFFSNNELWTFKNKKVPASFDPKHLDKLIEAKFNPALILITDKGEEAIRVAVQLVKYQRGWIDPVIAIPTVCCGSVYRAVKDQCKVILMDCDDTWNCVYDEESQKANIVLFASLSGKKKNAPIERKNQILIDDRAQCFDLSDDFNPGTDFEVFSFGAGKQMSAGGGGILCSLEHDLLPIKHLASRNVQTWQKYLMLSQMKKIDEINRRRRKNGLYLLEGLRDLSWLMLPDPTGHVFLKFVVFIDQGRKSSFVPQRTDEIIRFMRHMYRNGVQVEETYIPLHVRFPEELKNLKYQQFTANSMWPEAITLPCRPNLTTSEIDQIIDAVKSFQPKVATKIVLNEKNFSHKITDMNIDEMMEMAEMIRKSKGPYWMENVLQCPSCRCTLFVRENRPELECHACHKVFPIAHYIPIMIEDPESHMAKIAKLSNDRPGWYDNNQTAAMDKGPYRDHLRKRREYVQSIILNKVWPYYQKLKEFRNPRMLDFGCGDGHNLRWLKDYRFELYGADYNIERLIRAKTFIENSARIVMSDIMKLPFKRDWFDCIFLNHVIEHIPDDFQALVNLFEIVAPGGTMILGTPNEGSEWWQLAYKLELDIIKKTDHVHFYTGKSISSLCESAGFVVEELKYMGYGLPHWTADSVFRNIEGMDDFMDQIGMKFFPDQASSMYLVLRKPNLQ